MVTDSKEISDLLSSKDKNKIENPNLNGTVSPRGESDREPPDRGCRAYAVVIASFLTNGLLFGVINTYSVIYTVLLEQLQKDEVPNPEIGASLAGVLTISTTFFMSPLSGMLTEYMGLRITAMLGGTLSLCAMVLSSFFTHSVGTLCFTYGIMYGLGASLVYTPSLVILGHYFKKYLGLVNGIVTVGSSVFTVALPPIMDHVIKNHGLPWLFRFLACLSLGVVFCGFLFVPLNKPVKQEKGFKALLKTLDCRPLWRIKKYRFWAISMPVALFGYFVPYVHIKKFLEVLDFVNVNKNLPLQCIAITSAIGRLSFGFLSDRPKIDRILLQQISFYVIGTLTIILPFVRSFELIVAISLGMGFFEGGFIALIGPIAFEICGSMYAAQAIGCMLGMAATPLSVGPPVAGAIFSHTNSYTLPFVLAGISPIIGATFMFLIRYSSRGSNNQAADTNGHIPLSQSNHEKDPGPLLGTNNKVIQQTGSS